MKMSEAQKVVLSKPIYEHFDVWAGYWFTSTEDGVGPAINTRTLDALKAAGLIARGENARVASGRQRCPWCITPAGRTALSENGGGK